MHQPKPGRMAFICGHKDHYANGQSAAKTPPPRKFAGPDDPHPRCKEHGEMILQENREYLGQEIPRPF